MKRLCVALMLVGFAVMPATAQVPDEFTNLKVFPKDIGKRELISVMRQFSGDLGVRCNHCHKGPDNLQGMDFATDELENKKVARAMMKLTQEINDKLLPTIGRDSVLSVRCVTCHRGVAKPEGLDTILETVAEKEGVDAAIARYNELREEHYGAGSYDFSPGTLNGLAEKLAGEKSDMDGAIKVVQQNIELNPDVAYSHIMLGQLQMQKGDKTAALASLRRAIELDPDNGYAKRLLARIESAE